MKRFKNIFADGLFRNNPVLVQLVGLCSTLAITNAVENAIGMGVAVIFVLVCSNMVVSLLRDFIPEKVRIPSYIVIIATFVTIVQMFLQAYLPSLYNSLGVFLPLIVVNCIIFARAEGFASKNGVLASMADGLAQGLGYSWVIIVLAVIRELVGSGSILGYQIIPDDFTIGMFAQAPGAFIVLGIMIAIYNGIRINQAKKKKGA